MEIPTLVSVLDQPHLAAAHLHAWGLRDVRRGQQILLELAESGLTLDLLAGVCQQLAEHLPRTPDPDAALDTFHRYLFAVRSPLGLAALLERDPSAMPMLLAALSLGQQWAELLIDDPEAFDLLRQTDGRPVEGTEWIAEVQAEVEAFTDERAIVASLVRLRRRHLLRIAYGEVVMGHLLETTLQQLSHLAGAMVGAALSVAVRKIQGSRPVSSRLDPRQTSTCAIALGPLGAGTMSYAMPLELLFIYDAPLTDTAAVRAIHEYFERIAGLMQRLLQEAHGGEALAPVRLISLPDSRVAAAHAAEDVVVGMDSFGRTWHRQQMLRARVVAGNHELGEAVLARLEPWLFRRYLSRADETGIKALKRRIVTEAALHQDDSRNVRLARGGLRDLESTVELLQLLVGGDEPAVRQIGMLPAIAGLEKAGTITAAEHRVLEDTFRFLHRLEHRLQIALGPKASELPADESQIERIAAGLGHEGNTVSFLAMIRQHLDQSWQTMHKLLASAFPEEPPVPREVDLLLHPTPPPEEVRAALAPFGFADPELALTTLNELASEQVPFLSTRRCRHLLASILPRLLCAVGAAPNPDRTLSELVRVSDSLGGKGILWDLFRSNPPTLDLYVELCAASTYLSSILTTNPGMMDELVDSLQLDKLPSRDELQATLVELCRGAADTLPILHDFKNAGHLRIGVRDILGKEDVDRTHEALADVAEVCLAHVAELEYARLVEKFGVPTIGPGSRQGEPCRLVIVGLRRLGGREPCYHNPLDVLFLYEADGTTRPAERWRRVEKTANNHFFTQLAQRFIKQLSELTPKGRLYAIDPLLRPIGVGGALALPLAEFAQHFSSGAAPLWQWQALCQARPVWGKADAARDIGRLIQQLLTQRPWDDADVPEFRRYRMQLERDTSPQNLQRGSGGALDVELLVQMLQLKHGQARPEVLATNTQSAVGALGAAGILARDEADKLGESYRFLRRVESGLHLLDTSARESLPSDAQELAQLALLLGHGNPARLRDQCLYYMRENRALFDRFIAPQ